MRDETRYTAHPELRHPGRFLRSALRDLRGAGPAGWALFRSGISARHRRSWLGYLWLILPAAGTTLLWMYVQSRRIVQVPAVGIPYPVYLLAGTVLWQVFVDALNAPLRQLGSGRQIVTRSQVPLEALVFAGLLEALFDGTIRLLVALPVIWALGVAPGPTLLLAPLALGALALFGIAVGVAISPLGLLYDDVGRGIAMATGFLLFLSPVLYPARGLMTLNPLTPLLNTARGALLGTGLDARFVPVLLLATALLCAGWLALRLARPHVVARLG